MYRKHFALTRFPFAAELAPEELFAATAITEAEARLKHLLEMRAIALFTGGAGSGKTTVCRKAAATLHMGLYRLFYVPLSTGSVMDKPRAASLVNPWNHLDRMAANEMPPRHVYRCLTDRRPILSDVTESPAADHLHDQRNFPSAEGCIWTVTG